VSKQIEYGLWQLLIIAANLAIGVKGVTANKQVVGGAVQKARLTPAALN
jgi:hypothetical protein